MLKHCFTVLFLVLQARCITAIPPDGSNRALQLQFMLQTNAEGQELEEVKCKNSGLNFCIQDPLAQLAKLQDTINVTLHFLIKQTMEKVDAVLRELEAINSSVKEVDTSIQLLSSNLSQFNNSLMWSGKLLIYAQGNILTLELLTKEFQRAALETDRLQSKVTMTTLGLKKTSTLQEDAIALLEAINVTTFEVVAARIQVQYGLLMLNTSSLQDGEDAYSSVTELVKVTLNDATVVLQQTEQYYREATYILTNVTTLLSLLDTINRDLIGITELETAVDTSSTAAVLRETMETLVALQKELEVSRSLNQSVQEKIHSTETSLAITLSSLAKMENILSEVSELIVRIEEMLAELGELNREFMKQLQEDTTSVDRIEQHALLLFDQQELLIELAEGSGVLDCPTEFDRLAKTQSVINDAVILSKKVVDTLDNTIPAIVEHVAGVEERVKLVTVLVNTVEESLSELLLRKDAIIQMIAKHRAKLDERNESLEVVYQTIIQTSGEVEQIDMQIGLLEVRADNVWRSFFTSSIRIERAELMGSIVETLMEGIPRNIEEAKNCIISTKPKCGTVKVLQLEVQNRTGLLRDSIPAVESSLVATKRIVEEAERTVQSVLSFINANNVPLRIQDDFVLAMDLNATNESQELRSVSLTVEFEEVQDSILLHLTNVLDSVDRNTSLTIGVLNGSLVADFVQTHPALAADVVELIISETTIQPFTKYKIDATRTATSTHLLLKEMETGLMYSASATSSARLEFYFGVGFLRNAELHVGGAIRDSNIENTPFFSAKNSTGCVKRVDINGVRINLWSTVTLKTGVQPCTNSSLQLAEPLQLSLNGQQYSHNLLEDVNVFPIHLNFRTLLPNGQLLLARNSDQATLLEVTLNRGHILIRVSAGSRCRKLTSLELYNNGSSQAVTVMLTESQRGLILLTELEEVRRGLLNIDTGEVMNYTEVFIGGIPQEIGNQLDLSNFTGCARVLMPANPISELPMCVMDEEARPCSYCTDQAILSAAFYGASYVEFPSISIGDFFDLTFSLKTAFGDGLIAFAGNASQGNWIAVLLENSRVTLKFGSGGSSGISLPIRSVMPLDDDEWHEVTIVRVRSDLNFIIDGRSAGRNPFGGLLPSGSLAPNLYIGGISPESENILPLGISNEGLKGCLDGVHVLGKPLDFSINLGLEAVALDVCLRRNGNEDQDVYTFDGSAFGTFDLGRFESNFSVGFQFRTNSSSGLLLFAFSRKTVDAFAVQVRDTKVEFYIRSEFMERMEVSVTADVVVSDGQWHTVRVEKSGGRLSIMVDGVEDVETGGPEERLRTNSLLYIGGLSDNIRVPLPAAITSENFIGCLRINFLSHSQLTNVLTDQCKLLGTR